MENFNCFKIIYPFVLFTSFQFFVIFIDSWRNSIFTEASLAVKFADDTAIIAKTQEELQDMVNRLVDTGRKYGVEINIDKSQVMRVFRSNESLQIKVNNRELKEVDHFKYLGSVLTRDGYCTREIKMRIDISKVTSNRQRTIIFADPYVSLALKIYVPSSSLP